MPKTERANQTQHALAFFAQCWQDSESEQQQQPTDSDNFYPFVVGDYEDDSE